MQTSLLRNIYKNTKKNIFNICDHNIAYVLF